MAARKKSAKNEAKAINPEISVAVDETKDARNETSVEEVAVTEATLPEPASEIASEAYALFCANHPEGTFTPWEALGESEKALLREKAAHISLGGDARTEYESCVCSIAAKQCSGEDFTPVQPQ